MRQVIFAINVTLDGCCDHRKVVGGDDEMLGYYTEILREVDLEVFGRTTYELMVPYWPDVAKRRTDSHAAIEFARTFDGLQKVVFSRTLASTNDENTRVVRGNLRDEILKLKQEQGKGIFVRGVELSSQLVELGLVDEFRVVVGPGVAGEGRRLWDGLSVPQPLRLKLVASKVFTSGSVALRYLKQ